MPDTDPGMGRFGLPLRTWWLLRDDSREVLGNAVADLVVRASERPESAWILELKGARSSIRYVSETPAGGSSAGAKTYGVLGPLGPDEVIDALDRAETAQVSALVLLADRAHIPAALESLRNPAMPVPASQLPLVLRIDAGQLWAAIGVLGDGRPPLSGVQDVPGLEQWPGATQPTSGRWRAVGVSPRRRVAYAAALLTAACLVTLGSWLRLRGADEPTPRSTSPTVFSALAPSPTALGNILNGVTCAGASDCWAVGYSTYSPGAEQPLIQHSTGGNWAIVSTPNLRSGMLNGVTCASAADCWAVGTSGFASTDQPSNDQPLIEHYTGSSWGIVSSPNPSSGMLNGVTCASAADCWAVGYAGTFGGLNPTRALIEHYTGSSWAIVSTPNPGPGGLSGVTCVSAADCWAVGSSGILGGGITEALIDHYAGSSWAIVSTPNPSPGPFVGLSGVTCVSAGDCWAVGSLPAGGPISPPLIEHFAGSRWAISTPNPSTGVLYGVTCASAEDCWAVGNTFHIQVGDPLVERYTGSSWATVLPPHRGLGSLLNGVTCVSAADCWAVGGDGVDYELIEHYDGSIWATVSTPSPN